MAMDNIPDDRITDEKKVLIDEVGKKEQRKIKARSERSQNIWFGLGMMGMVGWSVAVPTLIGVALGRWVDSVITGNVSWTLTGMVAGVSIGCWNAWYWVQREIKRR